MLHALLGLRGVRGSRQSVGIYEINSQRNCEYPKRLLADWG